jgi:hypothetical protein
MTSSSVLPLQVALFVLPGFDRARRVLHLFVMTAGEEAERPFLASYADIAHWCGMSRGQAGAAARQLVKRRVLRCVPGRGSAKSWYWLNADLSEWDVPWPRGRAAALQHIEGLVARLVAPHDPDPIVLESTARARTAPTARAATRKSPDFLSTDRAQEASGTSKIGPFSPGLARGIARKTDASCAWDRAQDEPPLARGAARKNGVSGDPYTSSFVVEEEEEEKVLQLIEAIQDHTGHPVLPGQLPARLAGVLRLGLQLADGLACIRSAPTGPDWLPPRVVALLEGRAQGYPALPGPKPKPEPEPEPEAAYWKSDMPTDWSPVPEVLAGLRGLRNGNGSCENGHRGGREES